jgi:hypothetical protein
MVWPYLILPPSKNSPITNKRYGLDTDQAKIRCLCNWSGYVSKKYGEITAV